MKRILLLDDSPTIQRVVTLSFASTKGYDVKCASNLEAAKKCLAEARPDVLIAYVRFSGDANPDFFKTLGIPNEQILLLAESRENLELFDRAGLTQCVRKPFHTDELKKAILSIIGDDSISVEQISTPTLNSTPPPPAFRPTTTISMEALEKTFNRPADGRQQQRNTHFENPPVRQSDQPTRVPPPPPQMMAPPLPPPMRNVAMPPPPPIRRETQVQPLVSRTEPHRPPNLPPPPQLPFSSASDQGYDPMSEPDERTESIERDVNVVGQQANQPQLAFNMAQATFADADARREIKEWIARELPRIARDVVREELQKLLK